tara:strand:+ start:231 stop:1190 length:960 start_codon:yes stop_codon:yes gene_type:complete
MDNRSALRLAMKKRSVIRVASAHFRKLAVEEKKKAEIFEKIAPTYKSKLSDKEILWTTAYQDKSHPNHAKAVKDYQNWAKKNTGEGLTQKMISKRSKIGKALSSGGKKLASKTWAGIKAVVEQGGKEVKAMKRCGPILLEMKNGEFSKKSEECRKEDLKALYGSAVYLGGVITACMTAGSSSTLMIAGKGAAALGKSLATHAVIGSMGEIGANVDFFGFLSLETAETVATASDLIKGTKDFQTFMGGYGTTSLFDGVVSAVVSSVGKGIDLIASDEEGGSEEDKLMVEFLGRVYVSIGKTMSNLSNEEMEKITQNAGLM